MSTGTYPGLSQKCLQNGRYGVILWNDLPMTDPTDPTKRKVTFELPADLIDAMEIYIDRAGLPKDELARQALELYLEKEDGHGRTKH